MRSLSIVASHPEENKNEVTPLVHHSIGSPLFEDSAHCICRNIVTPLAINVKWSSAHSPDMLHNATAMAKENGTPFNNLFISCLYT